MNKIRDELDIRRRHLLDALDRLFADRLHGRYGWQRRDELVDDIGRLIERSDAKLLHDLNQHESRPDVRQISAQEAKREVDTHEMDDEIPPFA
jgi:hypothetical protein